MNGPVRGKREGRGPRSTPAQPDEQVAVRKSPRASARRRALVQTGPTVPVPASVEQGSGSAQSRLHEMQNTLDRLVRDVGQASVDGGSRQRAVDALGRIADRLGTPMASRVLASGGPLAGAMSVRGLSRRVSRLAMRHRADEVDEFGLDREYEAHIRPTIASLYERYFRVQAQGLHHIPETGSALVVCNRGGVVPLDGVMLKEAVARSSERERGLRWLVEDFTFHAPFLGTRLNRLGAVRACQENAQRLLAKEEVVAVFPEGVKGVSKRHRDRYKLRRFGRGGHVKLALRSRVPIIPAAIIGPEDAYPILQRLSVFRGASGFPFVPITPTFPLLGPLGLVPLPSRFIILVGAPVEGILEHPAEAAENVVVVNELNERVRNSVQMLLTQALEQRGHNVYR